MDPILEGTLWIPTSSLELDSHRRVGTSHQGPLNINIFREMTGRDTMYFRNFFEEPKRKKIKRN